MPSAASAKSYTYKSLVQLGEQSNLANSDPICSSAEPNCGEPKASKDFPKDYKVPNLGLDHEIINS